VRKIWLAFLALLVVLSVTTMVREARAEETPLEDLMIQTTAGEIDNTLAGFNITAIGLNSQAQTQVDILNQLSEINADLQEISTQLTSIENAIELETCTESLSSSDVIESLSSIATVINVYNNLLTAGESTSATVSQSQINDFLSQVNNGPGGGYPTIAEAFSTINLVLQGVNNAGIIGACEQAAPLPGTDSFGADYAFYADPLNLLQYFADYQIMATLLLVEYNDYEAFLNSPYYSRTVQANGLPANEAPLVCANPTGVTATYCDIARDTIEQLYVYLQNQYSADGVPYSTKDSGGNFQTGLYIGEDNTNYLFAASLEEFTNYEDIPQNNCPSVMTSSSPCGLTFSNDPSASPFWATLYDSTYQYESGWTPATAIMWRALLDQWTDGSSSDTSGEGLANLGFQNATDKIILTPTEYAVTASVGSFTPITGNAVCFLDTNIKRSFSHQPWCYNGSNDGVDYGLAGDLIEYNSSYEGSFDTSCASFRNSSTILNDTSDQAFYGGAKAIYDSDLNNTTAEPDSECPAQWVGTEPSWLVESNGKLSVGGYFWPALDVGDLTCGSNLSDDLQPAVTRKTSNFLGVPTMCGTDFDLYFADNVAPRDPYQQIVFTSAAASGASGSSATLGPITIEMQDLSSGTAVPLTTSSTTTVGLSSSSLTGVFSLTPGGAAVTSLTIPATRSTATFYYGDTAVGTPQITADPGTMVPGSQIETITSTLADETTGLAVADPSSLAVGRGRNIGTNKANAKLTMRGQLKIPKRMRLDHAVLRIRDLMDEEDGAGELLRRAKRHPRRSLSFVLRPIEHSTAANAVYATAFGVTPQVRINLAKNAKSPDESNFQVSVDSAEIDSAARCSSQSNTTIHTRFGAIDARGRTAVFDANLLWACESNHQLGILPVSVQAQRQRGSQPPRQF
jgi:hypothetical protein